MLWSPEGPASWNPRNSVAKMPEREEVRARHILVKTKAEADGVIKALGAKGATFEAVAKEKSKDGSAAQGGDLGYFTKDMMVPEFAEAAFALKPGEVSKAPVQTQFGWHVIKVEDRRMAKAPPFEEVQPQLQAQLSREEVLSLFQNLFGLAIGPFVGGAMSDAWGLQTALAVMPIFGVAAAGCFLLAARSYEAELQRVASVQVDAAPALSPSAVASA